MMEDIDGTNYVEYQTAPSLAWHPCLFGAEIIDNMVSMVTDGLMGMEHAKDIVFCDVGVGSTCSVQLQVYRRTKQDRHSLKTPVTE